MDRSFPFFNKWRIVLPIFFAVLVAVTGIVIRSIDPMYVSMYGSTYATVITTIVGLITLLSQEQVSKWNSFLIASGTDRTEFMRTRYISVALFSCVSAVLYSCIESAFCGSFDLTIKMILFNVALAAIMCAVHMYIFCRLGMTIRSQVQLSCIIIISVLFMTMGATIVIDTVSDSNIGVAPAVWTFAVSVIIAIVGYFACMRRIKRADM